MCSGLVYNEQWGESKRLIDFYDVKGDVEKILTLNKKEGQVSFAKCEHPALHPGKSASILLDQQSIGLLGELTLALPNNSISIKHFICLI